MKRLIFLMVAAATYAIEAAGAPFVESLAPQTNRLSPRMVPGQFTNDPPWSSKRPATAFSTDDESDDSQIESSKDQQRAGLPKAPRRDEDSQTPPPSAQPQTEGYQSSYPETGSLEGERLPYKLNHGQRQVLYQWDTR